MRGASVVASGAPLAVLVAVLTLIHLGDGLPISRRFTVVSWVAFGVTTPVGSWAYDGRMVKARLHDDCGLDGSVSQPRQFVAGDLECAVAQGFVPAAEVVVLPLLTVRRRTRTGFDEFGSPTFGWTDVLVDQPAVVWTERREIDDVAGTSQIVATVTVLYDGDELVTESASVQTPDGVWAVVAVRQSVGVLGFDLSRAEDTDG